MGESVKYRLNGKYDLMLPRHRVKVWEAWGGYWELERVNSMIDNINKGDVIFDIGAEEGDISALLAQKVGDKGGIVLFEPSPRVWSNIRAIFEANELKIPLGCYVGFASDVTDERPFNLDISEEVKGGWPISAYGKVIDDHGFRHVSDKAGNTPQVKLDDYCKRIDTYPDMITMDVEGSELNVLFGAKEVLEEYRPLVYVSIHPDFIRMLYNREYQEVHSFMKGLGYKEEYLATDHEIHMLFRPQ